MQWANLHRGAAFLPCVAPESRRSPYSATGPLVNIGLLERELGAIEYRLSKLPAGAAERADLETQKLRLFKALDQENAKQAKGRAGAGP
jgi:hypothetical protein